MMDKPRISEETREKIEDATLAIFMDHYAAALDAGIEKRMAECQDEEFPPELEKRCQTLIQREYFKERNKSVKRKLLRIGRNAAIFAVALLSVFSILFVTVEAFRVPVINFFAKEHDGHLDLRGTTAQDKIPASFNPDDPLEGILPADYTSTYVNNSWQTGLVSALYSNNNGSTVFLSIEPAEGTMLIDDEDAVVTQFRLIDFDAYLSSEGDETRLVWLDGNANRVFSICGSNVAEESIVYWAEKLVLIFN